MQYEQMTIEQLKEVLDLNGVKYRANASHDSLLELIVANNIQPVADEDVESAESDDTDAPASENQDETAAASTDVEPEPKEQSKEQGEQGEPKEQSAAAIERPYFAPAVLGSDTYPMQIRIVNSTLRERVFTRIIPENHSGIIPPLDSEGKVYTIANQSEAEMLELNIQEYAELEKWEDGAGIFIKGV